MKDSTPSACLTDTFSKCYTHSLSFNECAVVSDKMVSARKDARSAHVEISKMDVQDAGGKDRTAPKPRPHPIMPRGERVPVTDMQTRARAFPTFHRSPLGLCHSSVAYCLWRAGSTF